MTEHQDTQQITKMFHFPSPFQGLTEFTLSLTTITLGHLIEQNRVFGHALLTAELLNLSSQSILY